MRTAGRGKKLLSLLLLATLSIVLFPVGSAAQRGWAWSVRNKGASAPTHDIHGTGASDVWIGGSGGTVFHCDGSKWTRMNIGIDTPVYGILALDSSRVWATAAD